MRAPHFSRHPPHSIFYLIQLSHPIRSSNTLRREVRFGTARLTLWDIYLTTVLRYVALVSDVEDNRVDGHQSLGLAIA